MNKTLFEVATAGLDHQANKHDLGEDYAENEINNLSNWELLKVISEALEEMKDKP